MSNELQKIDECLGHEQVRNQVNLIQKVMNEVMKQDEHYGVIPGCGNKPALLKAGAEKLSLTFRLASQFKVDVIDLQNFHREYRIITTITHIPTGKIYGEGVGSCSTLESKYRYRNAALTCPKCSQSTIIKGKKEYGGGYICYKNKGGCGAKFRDNDQSITEQKTGKTETIDIADCYNTVLKMAKKRSLVDAILTVTAASDIFTQDIEEISVNNGFIDTSTGEVFEATDKSKELPPQLQGDYIKAKTHNIIKIQAEKNSITENIKSFDDTNKLQDYCMQIKETVKGFHDKEFSTMLHSLVKEKREEIANKISEEDVPQ